MWFIKKMKTNKRESGSVSLEAALALPLVLLIFLQLGLSLYAVSAELSLNAALQHLSKESNLMLAAQWQLREITPSQNEHLLKDNETNTVSANGSQFPLALLQDAALSKISAPLLEDRLSLWFHEHYDVQVNFPIIKDAKIFLETPQSANLGRVHLFYVIPGIWEDLERSQSVLLNDWRGFNDESEVRDEDSSSEASDSIWTWDNFSRGRAFQERYGANLSSFHPVVAKSENGNVSMIKSIDLTTKTYQAIKNLDNVVEEWLSDLAQFTGTEETGNVTGKTLLVVVPENSPYKQLQLLENKKIKAVGMGIKIEIIRDGVSGQEAKRED